MNKLASIIILILTAGCGTVGVITEDRAWAVVHPPIAHQMLLDTPGITIFDFRSESEFHGSLGHIEGAVSIPFDTIATRLAELEGYRRQTIIVYGDVESDTLQALRELAEAGFRNLVLIRGGVRNWIELGYKTVSSS